MNLQPYPAMKDSGVEWMGEVPEHWEVRRTKTVLGERSEKGFPDEPMLAATQTKGVVRKEQYENRTVLALKDLHLLKLVRVGDFVISLRSFQGGIEYAREQGIISPAYTILFTKNPSNHSFLSYLFKSRPYIENLKIFVTGIRQGQNIDYEKLGRSPLPLPPFPEQTAIVRYLDYVEQRVRRVVAAKRKLIGLLEELKRGVIHHAVTRGLNPDTPLKDSGVEWLGKVPVHWEVRRLGSMGVFSASGIDKNTVEGEPLVKMINYLDIYKNPSCTLSARRNYMIVSCPERKVNVHDAKVGDMFFTPSSETSAEIGASAVCVEYLSETVYSYHVIRFRSSASVNLSFKKYWCNNRGVLEQFSMRCKGTTRQILTRGDFRAIAVTLPPRHEQTAIAEHLDQQTTKIDTAITRARREIELLNEYRTRLIADVVTGKLDVRKAAANLPDESEFSVK